ncbi:MAG: hypothetical protein FWF79_00120 [Defluviitaleaceae bacterium]|nr:hypothetical protein [Defluviitaleaceae bacterium]
MRNNYADVMNTLDQHDYIVITNQGRGNAVYCDQDYFAELQDLAHQQYIYNELQKSKALLLENPDIELVPHEEVMTRLRARREARNRV